jgi:uncharacterized protein (TIGR02145 family)
MNVSVIKFLLLTGLILSSILTQNAQAQELQRLTVSTMEAPRTVAVFPDHPDKAALIFESTLTNLRFDSQMDGIVQIRDESANGRYIVIIEPFTQIISVSAPGFIQERLRIGNPQAREVRYFNVAPEQRSPDVISVIFNVSPTDARLFVDDQETDINQTVQIEPGQRTVRIEREGYRTAQEDITVSTSNISFSYSLEQVRQQLVRITTQPAQTEVFIDNMPEGATDDSGVYEMFRFPGTYQLRLNAVGHISVQTVIEVDENGPNEFRFSLERNVGILRLIVIPNNASILINQREQVLTNGTIELPPGMHNLVVTRPNHDSYTENINLQRGQTESRNITLTPHTGGMQLVVLPSDAQVRLLDVAGREVQRWTGSQSHDNLLTGNYRLEISASSHETKIEQLRISRNETANLRVQLSKIAQPVTRSPSSQTTIDAPASQTNARQQRDNQTRVVDVRNPRTGKIWMDRNLGATRAATSSTDVEAHGDLYQWGRGADGHEKRNSPTTTTLSSSDQPGHGSYIIAVVPPSNWRRPQNDNLWQGVNGVNNPCPVGYRIPTEAEWDTERLSWSSNNAAGAFASPLKLPVAGSRYFSGFSLFLNLYKGAYWSSSVSFTITNYLFIVDSNAGMVGNSRADGFSVRCIKD